MCVCYKTQKVAHAQMSKQLLFLMERKIRLSAANKHKIVSIETNWAGTVEGKMQPLFTLVFKGNIDNSALNSYKIHIIEKTLE